MVTAQIGEQTCSHAVKAPSVAELVNCAEAKKGEPNPCVELEAKVQFASKFCHDEVQPKVQPLLGCRSFGLYASVFTCLTQERTRYLEGEKRYKRVDACR